MSTTLTAGPDQEWVFYVAAESVSRLFPLRLARDVRIAIDANTLWVRGQGIDAQRSVELSTMADRAVLLIGSDDRLTPAGATVPTQQLPKLDWIPISEFLAAEIPEPASAPWSQFRVQLCLVRSDVPRPEQALLTNWSEFRQWGMTVSGIRLKPLRFAVSGQRVLVTGRPLPSLRGDRFWIAGQVLLPLGFHWSPAVDEHTLNAVILRTSSSKTESCGVNAGERMFYLWNKELNQIDAIRQTDFIPATRANISSTDQHLFNSRGPYGD
ncbi:MAG: hypothetical protein JNL58_25880 [Planctomyces sp.]|nr:hypothetical protein [Planctomyces sp.]